MLRQVRFVNPPLFVAKSKERERAANRSDAVAGEVRRSREKRGRRREGIPVERTVHVRFHVERERDI